MTNPKDEVYMKMALDEARHAADEGEVPVGAVLVCHDEILARDHNRKEQLRDPMAHAELLVLRKAVGLFPSWRFEETTLYVTLEPCLMCAGAIWQAQIDRLVYAADDPKAGAVQSLYQVLSDTRLNHQCELTSGVGYEESRELLQQFFRERRLQGKK
ncbi:MAG: tRNA adenosine(34) deaminase TadA [Planctomycetia bacterium]|nr:tRNA adenosine(34) deaminase TadA [Planctomycetia bacterium]